MSDLVLNFEDVGHFAVEAFRPHVVALGSSDQLHTYAHAIARFAHASFQYTTYLQSFSNVPDVLLSTPEGEGRSAGGDPQIFHAREGIDYFFGQPVAEVLVL